MPEGPEVRRQADRIAAALAGKPLTDVWLGFDHLEHRSESLRAAGLVGVETRGKAFLLRFGDGSTLYVHHLLYGRWTFGGANIRKNGNRRLRVRVVAGDAGAYLWSATEVELLDDVGVAQHPFLAGLGPDPLDPAITPEQVALRLADPRFRRRTLGALYLDQKFMAGIGNYMRSEILFDARVRPERRPMDLDPAQLERLARSTLVISRRAYEQGGVTSDAARVKAGKAAGLPRYAWRHYVFGRTGACPECGEKVAKLVSAGRRIYLCDGCQPLAEPLSRCGV